MPATLTLPLRRAEFEANASPLDISSWGVLGHAAGPTSVAEAIAARERLSAHLAEQYQTAGVGVLDRALRIDEGFALESWVERARRGSVTAPIRRRGRPRGVSPETIGWNAMIEDFVVWQSHRSGKSPHQVVTELGDGNIGVGYERLKDIHYDRPLDKPELRPRCFEHRRASRGITHEELEQMGLPIPTSDGYFVVESIRLTATPLRRSKR